MAKKKKTGKTPEKKERTGDLASSGSDSEQATADQPGAQVAEGAAAAERTASELADSDREIAELKAALAQARQELEAGRV
jgi:hypothetical protein